MNIFTNTIAAAAFAAHLSRRTVANAGLVAGLMLALLVVSLLTGTPELAVLAVAPTVAPFPTDPVLTGIAIGYRNPRYIADGVMPRKGVAKQEFRWWKYPVDETFRVPDTRVGRRSKPNEVSLNATEETDKTENHGLDDPVPQDDIDNAPPNYRPVDNAVMTVTDYVMLAREVRVAALAFDATKYPATNKDTLVGATQWSHADSNPIPAIMNAIDACLVRPNVMTLGRDVWAKLSQHPKIVKAIHGNEGDTGIARRQQVAELFELEEILVGESRLNTAKRGQAAVLGRVWGKHCLLHVRNMLATPQGGQLTYAITAEWRGRLAGATPDKDIGAFGGQRVRVVESVKEVIVAPNAAFLFTDAVA